MTDARCGCGVRSSAWFQRAATRPSAVVCLHGTRTPLCALAHAVEEHPVMRNLLVEAIGKRLQTADGKAAEQHLPDDIKQALAQLQRVRRRTSGHHGRGVRKARQRLQ
jgi:hypothetical protein